MLSNMKKIYSYLLISAFIVLASSCDKGFGCAGEHMAREQLGVCSVQPSWH